MTITDAKGYTGLVAGVTPSRTNASNNVNVGEALASQSWSDATIAYSFKVTATGGTDVARLTLSTGAVTQISGTPTRTDNDVDFEGNSLGAMTTMYGLYVKTTVMTGAEIQITSTDDFEAPLKAVGDVAQWTFTTGYTVGATTVDFTLVASGDEFEVVVIGK